MKLYIKTYLLSIALMSFNCFSAHVFILIGPSGVGKTTLIREILNLENKWNELILHTTRPIREGEIEGKDYFFITNESFQKKELKNKFILSSQVHGNWYGISKEYTNFIAHQQGNLIGNLSTEAAKQIKERYQDRIKTIFICPPSLDELKNRLIKRDKVIGEAQKIRLANALIELRQQDTFDYKIVNETIEESLNQLSYIMKNDTYECIHTQPSELLRTT